MTSTWTYDAVERPDGPSRTNRPCLHAGGGRGNVASFNAQHRHQVATIPLLLGLVLVLSSCGDSGADGEYIDVRGRAIASVVIDGDEITYERIQCDDSPKGDKNVGELNEEQTEVVWTQQDYQSVDGEVTITEDSVEIGDDTFVNEDSDQGDEIRAEVERSCKRNGE